MTTSEQAELKVLLRWVKAGMLASIVAAFGFGVWVATLQAQVNRVPALEAQIADAVRVGTRLASRVDSLIIILNERERRSVPQTNPLVAR